MLTGDAAPKTGINPHITSWNIRRKDTLLLPRTLPDQSLSNPKKLGHIVPIVNGIPRH